MVMHRLFLPAMDALAFTLAILATVEVAMAGAGGGGGGDAGHGVGFGLGGGVGHGSVGLGLGGGPGGMGFGGSHSTLGLGFGRGLGSPGGDDIHLGLSSRELGLGNNFGLDAPDNVLSRAARIGMSPLIPGMGTQADDRPSLQGLGLTGDSNSKGSQASRNGSKANVFKKDKEQVERSTGVEVGLQLLQQSQLAAERQANLPPLPSPPSAAASTTTITSPVAPAVPDMSPLVTTTLGSGEVTMIGAYFAQHGAPVASIPTGNINVSVGGTVPDSVALFPPPYDLVNQVSDPDFSYFVWGQNVVIVDGQTNVVSAIVPDVLAHQD
jgi:hypothetical protein